MKRHELDRREFLKQSGTILGSAALAPYALAGTNAQSNPSSAGRLVLPMNRNWRYSRSVVQGGHDKDFNDSSFDRIAIPHTNVKLPWHGFDEKTYVRQPWDFQHSLFFPPLVRVSCSKEAFR